MTEIQPPVFGVNRKSDFAPKTEEPEWRTIGIGSWMYDSPMWDPNRIRLGRVDKLTRVRILQSLTRPNDSKKRTALEVAYPRLSREGKPLETRFWVYPNRNGFEGMPIKQTAQQKDLKL